MKASTKQIKDLLWRGIPVMTLIQVGTEGKGQIKGCTGPSVFGVCFGIRYSVNTNYPLLHWVIATGYNGDYIQYKDTNSNDTYIYSITDFEKKRKWDIGTYNRDIANLIKSKKTEPGDIIYFNESIATSKIEKVGERYPALSKIMASSLQNEYGNGNCSEINSACYIAQASAATDQLNTVEILKIPGDNTSSKINENSTQVNSLKVSVIGSGIGSVSSNTKTIDCGTTCDTNVKNNSIIELTAMPEIDSSFSGWSGDCQGSNITCTLPINSDKKVIASFEKGTSITKTLTIRTEGLGTGTVVSLPEGIDCGIECIAGYPKDTAINLKAIAGNDSLFLKWNGDACYGETPNCTVYMGDHKTISAIFQTRNKTISVSDASVTEGDLGTIKNMTFTLILSTPANKTINVKYATVNGTASTAEKDYISNSGIVSFKAGEISKSISIKIPGDKKKEYDENFTVSFSLPTTPYVLEMKKVSGTIINDD
jgi:hypothetical protein